MCSAEVIENIHCTALVRSSYTLNCLFSYYKHWASAQLGCLQYANSQRYVLTPQKSKFGRKSAAHALMKDHFAVGPRKTQRAGCKVTQREPTQVLTWAFFLHNSLFLSHRHNVPGAHLKQEPSSADGEVFRSFSHSTYVYVGRLPLCVCCTRQIRTSWCLPHLNTLKLTCIEKILRPIYQGPCQSC